MNGKHFYTILLIGFVLFLAQGCKTESPVSPAPSATPTPSATWTPTVVVSPSPTVKVPTPTPDLEKRLEEFINIFSYSAGTYRSATAYGVRGLEYLVYLSPQSDQREALIKSILNNSFGHWSLFDLDWLLVNYMQTALLGPLNAPGKVPPEVLRQWNMTEMDLDADQEPDYVFLIYFRAKTDTSTPNVFYWLHKVAGVYELTEIVRFSDYSLVEVLSTKDITNNGVPDLAFQATHIGSPISTHYVHIFEWQEDHWNEIPVLPEEWVVPSGHWHVEDTNGKIHLAAFEGNAGELLYGSTPPYEILFEYIHGAFIPIDVREPIGSDYTSTTTSEYHKILWADELTRFGFPKRALDILLSQKDWNNEFPPANYSAYVLFRIGVLHLYLGDMVAAREAWQRIEIESPDSPVASSVPELLQLVEQPDPLWKICHWLKEYEVNWNPDAHFLDWPYDWYFVCWDNTLVRWQKWNINRPIQQQAEQFNLEWTLLSDAYDLNQDDIPDPIGRLDGWLWVFLSDNTVYAPMLIGPQVPQQAILLSAYDGIGPDEYVQVHIYRSSPNTPVWLELIGRKQVSKYQWTGDYFKFHPVEGLEYSFAPFARPPDPNNHLTQALLALFRDENPARALELLQTYTSDDEWETLTARYVTAIALKYNGQADLARPFFESIIADYPDTGWATFSREHLQTMGDK